jgi:hypothetical protein
MHFLVHQCAVEEAIAGAPGIEKQGNGKAFFAKGAKEWYKKKGITNASPANHGYIPFFCREQFH